MKSFFNILLFALASHSTLQGQTRLSDHLKPSQLIKFCNDQTAATEIPIHKDWVEIDKNIIKTIINNLPSNCNSISDIQKLLPHFLDGKCNCGSISTDMGHGIKTVRYTINGGYGTFNVDAICYGDFIIKLRIIINNHKDIFEDYLFDEITQPFECIDGKIMYDKIINFNVRKYIADSGKLYIESLDTNYRRSQALNYFTDVLTGGTFCVPYYITFGLGSETFNNLRYFIVNKDYVALENILYSVSPTSRLFAARTLIYMENYFSYKPEKIISKRIENIMSQKQIIYSGIISCFINKFEYDQFDFVNNFEYYLSAY